MEDLIRAFQIFLRYGNVPYPTHCEHDVMYVMVNPAHVTDEDKAVLDELGFYPADEDDYIQDVFYSFKYGSA